MEEERGKSFSEIWKEELDRLPEDLLMRNEDLQAPGRWGKSRICGQNDPGADDPFLSGTGG